MGQSTLAPGGTAKLLPPQQGIARLEEALAGGDPAEVVTAFDALARTAPDALQERGDLLEQVAAMTHAQLADIGAALQGLRAYATGRREASEREASERRDLARAVAAFESDAAEVRTRGEELLARAEGLGEPELARVVVEHLRGPAALHGNWRRVLDLQRRLAHVAAERGEVRAMLRARCDEALALSQLGEHAEAREVAEATVVRAALDAYDLVPRAALSLGRVLEEAGEPGRAREAYAGLLERLDGDAEAEVAWALAAAGIARTLVDVPAETERRRRLLEVARSIATRHEDADLYREALLGCAQVAAEEGDLAKAVRLAVDGRIHTSALGGHAMAAPFDGFLAELDELYGRAPVQEAFEDALHGV